MYVPIWETRLDECIAIEAQSDRTDRVEKHGKTKGENTVCISYPYRAVPVLKEKRSAHLI
jgi:hypothetical protein